MHYVISKSNDPHEARAKQVADIFLCKFQICPLLRGYLGLKPSEKCLFFAYGQAACDWEWRRQLFGTGRARWDYSGVKRWEGKHGAPPKFPKGQFTVMDGYAVAVKFLLCGPDREGRGMLSDSREHLSCLEFRFSVPTRLMTGQGLFFGVCGGKHGASAFWVVKHRPCVFQRVWRSWNGCSLPVYLISLFSIFSKDFPELNLDLVVCFLRLCCHLTSLCSPECLDLFLISSVGPGKELDMILIF